MAIRYRVAHAGDAEHVAALHTASWRRHHRGAYADSYLDEDADRGSSSTTCTSPGPQQRSGIGTALLDRAAQGILERVTGPRAYLWVLEQNAAAQLFCRVPRPWHDHDPRVRQCLVQCFFGHSVGGRASPPPPHKDDQPVSVHLETERLVLRELTAEDVDHLVALDTDPDVARWSMDPAPSREDVEQRHLPYFRRLYEMSPGYGFWAAEDKATGAFLGWFHLRPREGRADDEPELGYRLHGSAWGRGYATEGSRALIDKAFTELPIRRIVAETAGFHVASRRVMEKAGLRLVREYESSYPPLGPDDVLGDVEYAVTRAEWEQQRRMS